ncbi:MAG: hypothetical protein ACFFD4_13405 [Candidatus Odinarchaeota archaeon]
MAKDKLLEAFKRGQEKGISEQQFYNEFGFSLNPFDGGNPITADEKSFFYEDIGQLEPFMELLGSHFTILGESRDPFATGSHLLLVGATGQGKSAIFKYVQALLGDEHRIALLDLEDLCFDRAEIPRPRQWSEILPRLPALESRIVDADLLFLDGIGYLAAFLEPFVQQFWTSSSRMPLIVASISKKELIYLKKLFLRGGGGENLPFFFNFFHSHQFSLRPYTVEEIKNILQKRIHQSATANDSLFTNDIVSRIARLSHGIPELAFRIGESLLRIAATTKNRNLLEIIDSTSFTRYREAVNYSDEINGLVSSNNLRYHVFRELLTEAGRFKIDRGIDVSDPVFVTSSNLFEQYAVQNTTLATAMDVGNSTVSYHLGSLTKAGILHVHKSGKNRFYQLREPYLSLFESLDNI